MKILITHVYSKWNYGDAAILSSNIKILKNFFPDSKLGISSMGSRKNGHSFENIKVFGSLFGYAVYSHNNSFGKLIDTAYVLLFTSLWAFCYKFFGIDIEFLINKHVRDILKEYKNADLIAAVGGGYITGKNNFQSNITILLQLHSLFLAKFINKKVVLFPQSIGPFGNKFQEIISSFTLNLVDVICVREKITEQTLKRINVNKPRIIRSGDLAFLLQTKKIRTIDKYLTSNFIDKKKLIVGVTVRQWMDEERQEYFENEMAKFINYLVDDFGAYVVFIPQVSVYWSNDVDHEVFERIVKKVNNPLFVKQPSIASYEECLYFCSKLDYLVGTRMHSNIFALINHVPALAISYEYKTIGIMEDLKLSDWVIKIEDVTSKRLEILFKDLVKRRKEYLDILDLNLNKYLKTFELNLSSIKDLAVNTININFSNCDDMKNPYYGGGGAFAIHEVAKRLAKKYNVKVFTSKYPGAVDTIIDNVQYKRVGFHISPRIDQLIFNLLIPYYVLTSKFDIWFESFTPPVSVSLAPIFTKKPVIGVTHFFNAEDKSKQYKLPFYLIQNFGIKFYKYCIALTLEAKNKVLKLNPNINIAIIPNGVNIPKKKSYKIGNYILYLGRIEVDQKGISLLINAYKKIEGATNLQLFIAGDGPIKQVSLLKKIITINKLNKRVKLLGRVEGERKERLIGEAKFIVIPSKFENLSLVALEAIVRKKPVLSFDISGFKWMPRGTSVRVPAFSTEKYAEAMLTLAEDKNLRGNISMNAKKYSERFSWPKITKQYETLIEKLT